MNRSLDLAVQYNQAKAAWDKAVETATQNYSKKRGVAGELKQYKEQKSEVERWESMQEQKVCVEIWGNGGPVS